MNLDITPFPEPKEREALVAGVERLLANPARQLPPEYLSAWRLAGIKEATGDAAAALGGRRTDRS